MSNIDAEIQERMTKVLGVRLRTADELHAWLRVYLGLNVPRHAVCAGHDAPFDYVQTAYFEPAQDMVVWAPRGGGKTTLGAAVTLLELLHKPGVQVRILGGSLEQSMKMWECLKDEFDRVAPHLIESERRGGGGARMLRLTNLSRAGILAQSQRAVRGLRVQKLRCDEVEMFDPAVWEAAQLVTRSAQCGQMVRGVVEAMSTFHQPWGLMSKVIESARQNGTKLLKWCIVDVMEPCPEERDCKTCVLWEDCGGVAKTRCDGFMSIDDLIRQKHRVSIEMWRSEMLCHRPSVQGAVFPRFSAEEHVGENIEFATPRAAVQLAMDFGFASPFVCLWVVETEGGKTFVVDEYVQEGRMLHEHLEVIEARQWGRAKVISCDPAGNSRNEQTAQSNVSLLRQRGYTVRSRKSAIADGIEMIRLALHPAAGAATLVIARRCRQLIESMQKYHYAPGGSEVPVKDGADHCVDALRYYFVNRGGNGVTWRRY
jgi:hypothetical protein